jgi:hypothetical protein
MDNATKRQTKRVNDPTLAQAAPGRDVLLALATAWSSSNGFQRAGGLGVAATSPAAPRTFGVTASTRRTGR